MMIDTIIGIFFIFVCVPYWLYNSRKRIKEQKQFQKQYSEFWRLYEEQKRQSNNAH